MADGKVRGLAALGALSASDGCSLATVGTVPAVGARMPALSVSARWLWGPGARNAITAATPAASAIPAIISGRRRRGSCGG